MWLIPTELDAMRVLTTMHINFVNITEEVLKDTECDLENVITTTTISEKKLEANTDKKK